MSKRSTPTIRTSTDFGNGWEDIRTIHEMVEVKGEAPRDIEMQFTRHGPVLATDPANHRAFSMRSVWFEPGTSAYFGSSDYMTAQNWCDAELSQDREAIRHLARAVRRARRSPKQPTSAFGAPL